MQESPAHETHDAADDELEEDTSAVETPESAETTHMEQDAQTDVDNHETSLERHSTESTPTAPASSSSTSSTPIRVNKIESLTIKILQEVLLQLKESNRNVNKMLKKHEELLSKPGPTTREKNKHVSVIVKSKYSI